MNPWYHISNIDEIDSPALIIYPGRIKKNIDILKRMIDDTGRLRPHAKTHKTKETASLLIEAGISKFKCATIAEAEMLALAKAPDVLLAYQPVGPKVHRLISLIKKFPATKFSCLVDNIAIAKSLAEKMAKNDVSLPVYIDLNVGMNRTGIVPGEKALELYEQCSRLNGIVPTGLHAYDGHIHDPDFKSREKKCNEAFAAVESLREAIIKKGLGEPIIVAGGSPTFPIHAARNKIECSPGTFIYWDAGYLEELSEQPFLPAAVVISRVISLPNETTICTDLGHKSIAAEKDLLHRVSFINAKELKCIGQSEEHLVLQANKDHQYKIGDVLYGLPFHICPTCALYERALVVEDEKMTTEWKIIARDRKINC